MGLKTQVLLLALIFLGGPIAMAQNQNPLRFESPNRESVSYSSPQKQSNSQLLSARTRSNRERTDSAVAIPGNSSFETDTRIQFGPNEGVEAVPSPKTSKKIPKVLDSKTRFLQAVQPLKN